MVGSPLVNKQIQAYSGNYTKNRSYYKGTISEVTVHHCAGVMTIEQLGALWQTVGREGSSTYGIRDNTIGQYVSESDIAWCNSNWEANKRAISIEVSNSAVGGNWPVSDASINTLVELLADISIRNNLGNYTVGKNLTYHSMYSNTACPGQYLKGQLQNIANRANARIAELTSQGSSTGSTGTGNSDSAVTTTYIVQVGAYNTENDAQAYANTLKDKGIDAAVTFFDGYYRTQCGSFEVKSNAEQMVAELKSKGIEAIVKEKSIATTQTLYTVQAGAFSKVANANAYKDTIISKGFSCFVAYVNGLYRCQCGAFSKKENADAMVEKLKSAGINAIIK